MPQSTMTTTKSRPLKVVIVGAGIAGLTAAIAIRQQGHEVHLYEQSQFADEIGAAIHISPNANSVLQRLGVDVAEKGAPKLMRTRYFDPKGRMLFEDDNDAQSHRWQASWLQAHRGHLHSQLKEQATSQHLSGTPAQLSTSCRVVTFDHEKATITLDDGTVVESDVLVGADGIRSKARRAIAGSAYDSFEIGKNAFRFMVPRAKVVADPVTRELGEALGTMDFYFAEEHKVIIYPCVNNTLLNVVAIHPARQSSASAETYNKSVTRETLLNIFSGFSPKLLRLFEKCDNDTLKVYPLFDAPSIPTFIMGRLALIGDAAHPFTPFIGQGGATAIEDAVSLGVMLSTGLDQSEVEERLQVYNKARYSRATLIQGLSRTAGSDGVKPGQDERAKMKAKEHAFYALSHDEYHSSTQVLREHQWSKLAQPMWRQPIIFGPAPGPSCSRSSQHDFMGRTDIATIVFKTSGTLLRNMFPNQFYAFASADTVAFASLKLENHHDVGWLNGHGFRRISLLVHGVKYTLPDSSTVSGDWLPVVFEDSADSISAGREELGLPSVFSDVELETTGEKSLVVSLSWRGTTWAKIWWRRLYPVIRTERPPQDWWSSSMPTLVHRRIPAVGVGPGPTHNNDNYAAQGYSGEDIVLETTHQSTTKTGFQSNGDSDIDVNLPSKPKVNDDTTGPARRDLIHQASPEAGFEFSLPLDEKKGRRQLPTLHPIVTRLAELPVFDVVSATLTKNALLEERSRGARKLRPMT